ncbi:MAG: MFS transporter [Pseudomonadales bacterium]|nr:MFS transporter [Pseudomonadales bacterium]
MTNVLASVTALLVSVAILLVGHGLQLTLAPMYADSLGWTAQEIGYTGSAYFGGFVVGCLVVPTLVARVGHIRMFAVLASTATAALLLLGLFESVVIWMIARGMTGLAFAGLYMVIESWLNERTTSQHRATVLSIYVIITLIAICGGQLLVGLQLDFRGLIMLSAILLVVGMIPVGLTRSVAPAPIPAISFKFREVYRASHVAVVGAFVGGLVTAGFWSLGPVVAKGFELDAAGVGVFMASAIFGGAVAQLPLGRLSDRMDRRVVLAAIAMTGMVVNLGAFFLVDASRDLLYIVMFLYGGVTFPIYSLCLAHANDNTDLQLMEIASVILMTQSVGAVVGPLVVAALMAYSSSGLFLFAGVVLAIFTVWTLWRIRAHETERAYFEPYHGVPRTTHAATEIYAPELSDTEM